ncbi:MAG: hypothetical protein JW993_20125 [Sedimentisphaerales bacterium]|nr:hypothetical protein [Sedimentisphaerales bacterium]
MKKPDVNKTSHEPFVRHGANPILSVEGWPYKANAVFNAAAAEVAGQTLLLVRVEDCRGISHLVDVIMRCPAWTQGV